MSASSPTSPCRSAEASAGGPAGADGGSRSGGPRPSKSTAWRFGVLIAVHVAFLLHLLHLSRTGSTLTPVEPSEAMEFSKRSVINAGFVFFALTIGTTLIVGRFFCGWGCHMVALQDAARSLLLRWGIRPKPLRSRLLACVPMIAFVYMFLWPAFYRLWIGEPFPERETEFFTSDFWRTFPGVAVALATFLVCGFASVYFLGAKGFCTYACPYGAAFGMADRLAPGRIRVTDACEQCGHCTAACTSNVLVHREVHDHGMVVDAGCMKCMDCVSVCPTGALYFGFGKPGLLSRPKHAPRPRKPAFHAAEEAFLAATFLIAFLAFRGLYQAIPFLFSLGIAGIAAYCSLCAWRMLRAGRVRIQNWTLKEDGRWTGAGRTFGVGFALFASLWAHSGWIQFHTWRADAAMEALAPARARWLRLEHPPLDEHERALLSDLRRHNGRVVDFALHGTPKDAYRQAWADMLGGNPDGYATWLARGVERERGGTALAREYAGYLNATGDLDACEAAYRTALERHPDDVPVTVELAEFLARRRGDLAAAREVLERGLGAHPGEASLHHGLGLLLSAGGDGESGTAAFRRAVALAPLRFEFRDNLVRALFGAGAVEEALGCLREGVRLHPEGIREQTALGMGLLAAGDVQGGEEALRRAVELGPDTAVTALQGLSELLEQTGRPGEAKAFAERAESARQP